MYARAGTKSDSDDDDDQIYSSDDEVETTQPAGNSKQMVESNGVDTSKTIVRGISSTVSTSLAELEKEVIRLGAQPNVWKMKTEMTPHAQRFGRGDSAIVKLCTIIGYTNPFPVSIGLRCLNPESPTFRGKHTSLETGKRLLAVLSPGSWRAKSGKGIVIETQTLTKEAQYNLKNFGSNSLEDSRHLEEHLKGGVILYPGHKFIPAYQAIKNAPASNVGGGGGGPRQDRKTLGPALLVDNLSPGAVSLSKEDYDTLATLTQEAWEATQAQETDLLRLEFGYCHLTPIPGGVNSMTGVVLQTDGGSIVPESRSLQFATTQYQTVQGVTLDLLFEYFLTSSLTR